MRFVISFFPAYDSTMHRILISAILVGMMSLLVVRDAMAQQLSPTNLNKVKSATVYLKVTQSGGDAPLQGSGFLIRPT